MTRVHFVEPDRVQEWDELVGHSRYASIYHLWRWGEVLSATYGHPRYYLEAEQNGNLVGAFPLIHVKSVLFGNRLISIPFCEYGGPLVDPKLSGESKKQVLSELLHRGNLLARSLGAGHIEIRGSSTNIAALLVHRGYNCLARYATFKIDLTHSVEALWDSLDKKTRNATKKAMKKGVKVVEAKNQEELEGYYKLHLETAKRHGSPPHSFEFFQNTLNKFQRLGMVKVLLAQFEGKLVSGITILQWKDKIYWKNNVTDTEYRSLNATNLLLWHTIKSGANEGFKVFDFGRTRPNTGVHHFKKGWGGQEVKLDDYMHFLKRATVPPDPNQRRYVLLSKLWSLVPTATSRHLGPRIIGSIAP